MFQFNSVRHFAVSHPSLFIYSYQPSIRRFAANQPADQSNGDHNHQPRLWMDGTEGECGEYGGEVHKRVWIWAIDSTADTAENKGYRHVMAREK